MRIYIQRIDDPNNLMEMFKNEPMAFLIEQEFMTDYKIKTISQLLDELQKITEESPEETTTEQTIALLSKEGKRRYNTILNQLKKLIEIEADRYVAGKKYKCVSGLYIERFDEDGNSTDEFMKIEAGSVWEVDDKANIIGGEVHIKNPEKLEWLEVSKNTLFLHFEPVE